MRQADLKILRLILALLFIISTGYIFLDFREILNIKAFTAITYLQFIPSLIKFFAVFSLVSAGFIAVLVLTVMFGRVYCGSICPLGILQDIISWIRKKTKRKTHRYRFGPPHNYWRYGFLALPFLILLAGRSLIGINLLDPYSIFGRITSDLGLPVTLWINNRFAGILESMNLYFLYPVDINLARGLSYLIPVLMMAIVFWFSFRYGRLYCNTICPVGTLLGLISRFSVFKIKIVEIRCTSCAKCAFTCKSSCIDVKNLEVDFSRCVGCFNCLQVCPEDAIMYFSARSPLMESDSSKMVSEALNTVSESSEPNAINPGRRELISQILLTGFVLMGLPRKAFATVNKFQTDVPVDGAGGAVSISLDSTTSKFPTNVENKIPTEIEPVKNFPVSPPGSMGLRHFNNHCTACHLCVSACPTKVLQPSINEFGLTGILQPHMDYSSNYCNFECVKCAEVCPSGAILSLTEEAKKTVQLGQVNLILENCVVYTENTACGSCSEHCPTQAVTMVPYRDNLTLPEIKPAICVGCGACEYACPVRPHKAIFVDGHEIHQIADLPEIEELEETVLDDFPF